MRKITNELICSFKEYLIEEEKSENTTEKYIRDISFFMAWLCGQTVTKILALEYKKELCEKYAHASVNAAISSLNSFFAFMEWHDIRIKALKIQRQIFSSKDKELTKAEYERLLTAAKDKVYPHSFRHLFARTYYSLQKDIVRLADILGHSSVNTTRIYTMSTDEVHRRQIQKFGLLRC